ncbi:MAG: DNA double-strand break repair nuclease NurA [Chloroflexi bacterium]|jgi:hypothetical protein|nr:DNA double-strand break repair nuclease NurA [Chloroflexota bacterium]
MALDFLQVREKVKAIGENAALRERQRQNLREEARRLLDDNAQEVERLREKIELAARSYDPTLRCALPVQEPLNAAVPLPELPPIATIIAADGSQINPDRNAPVDYCLINVGAIQMVHGLPDPPAITLKSDLFYDEEMFTDAGTITEGMLALMRDLRERTMLAELAEQARPPVITFTDGPMELWGAKDGDMAGGFQKSLEEYQTALERLCEMHVVTAGYVDKPAANLVVRMLEIGCKLTEDELVDVKHRFPLRGVTDYDLYRNVLKSGERSAVFAIQSKSAGNYRGSLALHFFYLNVGRPGHPWLARVEIPRWVADNPLMLEYLHAALVHQTRIMGSRPYPYILHRAHEAAVVSFEDKEQVNQMIAMELRRRGVPVGEQSQKQAVKELQGRTSFSI